MFNDKRPLDLIIGVILFFILLGAVSIPIEWVFALCCSGKTWSDVHLLFRLRTLNRGFVFSGRSWAGARGTVAT